MLFAAVPYDVWLSIAAFLSIHDIRTLHIVNRTFFDIATTARYERIVFGKFTKGVRRLCDVLHNLDLARRELVRNDLVRSDLVHHVHVKPYLIQPRVKPPRTYQERSWNAVLNFFDPHSAERKIMNQAKRRMEKDITRIARAVDNLKHLREYTLTWDERCSQKAEMYPYRAFLNPILTRMADRLSKLSLDVPMEVLRFLEPVAMSQLQHFDLALCTLDMSPREIDYSFDALTVFVNNLDRTLHSLTITCRRPSQNLDLTYFFSNLGVLTILQRFSLTLPFDGRNLSSPPQLALFLRKQHRTLQHLQLTVNPCSAADNPTDPKCKYWIPNVLAATGDNAFPQLRSVQLALRPLKADLKPIIAFLRNYEHQLESLSLTDRELRYEEVKTILDGLEIHPLASLKRLQLRLCGLGPDILALLARRLPELQVLELTFRDVRPCLDELEFPPSTLPYAETYLNQFKTQLRQTRSQYAMWKVRKFGVRYGNSNEHLHELTPVLFRILPYLQDVFELPLSVVL